MPNLSEILNWFMLALVAAATFSVTLMKKGLEKAVEKSAENAINRINWSSELERALQKTRGEQRQELRFQCYAALWADLRPLALYASKGFDRSSAATLTAKLSDWYFSTTGGLLLTREARDFYFALQDLLRGISTIPSVWQATATPIDQRPSLRSVFSTLSLKGAAATLDYFDQAQFENWSNLAQSHGAAWRSDLSVIAQERQWLALDSTARFAVLQQAGSVLRSALTADIESRLR